MNTRQFDTYNNSIGHTHRSNITSRSTRTTKRQARKLAARRRLIILIGVMVTVFTLILLYNVTSSAQGSHEVDTYYTNVYVESGDTLWDIATANYSVEYGSFDKYMNDIKSINHITDSSIHSGEYIVVPYSR